MNRTSTRRAQAKTASAGALVVRALLAVAVGHCIAQHTFAANKYWDTVTGVGGGLQAGNGTWNTSTNIWSTAATGTALTVWANNDDAFFQTGGSQTVTLSGTIQANSVTQTVAGTATTLTGGTALQLQTNAGVVNSGNQTLNINSAVTLNASDVTFNAGSGANISVGGAIGQTGGTRGLTKSGVGTLTFSGSGANTYAGTTTVNAGELDLNKTAGTNAIAGNLTIGDGTGTDTVKLLAANQIVNTSDVTINTGGVLDLNGNSETIDALDGSGTVDGTSGTPTLTLGGNNGGGTFSGVIQDTAGTLSLTKSGSGTQTLSGNNSYAGATSVTAGILNIQHNSALGTTGSGTTVSSGASLELQGGITVTGEALSIDGTGTASNGALRNLSGANTWTGTVTLNGDSSIQSDAGSLTLTATNSVNGTNDDLTLQGNGDGTIGGTITTGNATLTKNGSGTWTLQGNNTYTGATSVTAGVLNIQHANATGTTAGGVTVSSGAALEIQGGISVGAEALSLTGTGVSNNGAFRNISGSNTYGGTVTLAGATEIQVDAGSLTLSASNAVTATNQNLTFDGSGNGTISGTITIGTGTLTKNGAGTLTFSGSGANTYSGTTTVNAGELDLNKTAGTNAIAGNLAIGDGTGTDTVKLLAANQIANSSDVTVNAGGVLDLNGNSETIDALSGSGTVDGTSGTPTLTLGGNNGGGTFSGVIQDTAGTLSLTKSGTGTQTLSGNNSYAGATSVSAGILNIQHNSALGTTGSGTTVSSGAALEVQGGVTVGAEALSLTGTGVSNNGALRNISGTNVYGGTLTLTGATELQSDAGTLTLSATNSVTATNQNLTLDGAGSGAISGTITTGSGTLSKNGTGSWTLSGNNTYTGTTTVSDGVLTIEHANALGGTSNGTTVSNGATLAVQGGISVGNESLSINGTGDGGNGALRNVSGTNTYGGTVTLAGNSRIQSDAGSLTLSNSNSVTGSNDDLTLAGAANGTISGSIATGSGTLVKTGAGTWTLNGSSSFTGITTVDEGVLEVAIMANGGSNSSLGAGTNAASRLVLDDATLRYTGTGHSSNRLFTQNGVDNVLDASGSGPLNLTNSGALGVSNGGHTLTLTGSNTGANTIAAEITEFNAGSKETKLFKTGAGTWVISGANSYTGLTDVQAGILRYGASNVINNGPVQVTAGTLDIGTFSDTVGVVTLINGAIDGTTGTLTGNSYDVRNGSISAKLGGNNPLTKSTAGTVTLSGANTYTGTTTVSGGKLILGSTGSLANTATSVASGATFAPQPGSGTNSAGSTGAGSAGATLNVAAGALFDMTDNAIGVFNLNQQTSFAGTAFTIGALTGTAPTLTFEIGNAATGTDRINVTKAASVLASGGKITISSLAGNTSLTSGNYTLMTATSGLGVAGLTLNTPTITLSGKTYNLSLANSTATTEILSISVATPGTAYWSGGASNNWNTINAGDVTNWRTDATNNIDTQQLPGATTDVFFNTTAPVAANLTNTLGANFSIKSLTYTSAATSSVTTGGANTLTVGTGGITVQSGSAAHTINSGVALGSTQTWTNNSGNLFTVSGNIANGANTLTIDGSGNTTLSGILGNGVGGLTKNGAGTLTLSGSNSYTGATIVNGGTLSFNTIANVGGGNSALGAPTSAVNGTIDLAGTLRYTGSGHTTDRVVNLTGTGTVEAAGSNPLVLAAATSSTPIVTGNTQNLVLAGAGNGEINGRIATTSGTVTKTGSGTWVLAGDNAYNGATNVNQGTLRLRHDGAAGHTGGGVDVQDGAALELEGGISVGNEALTIRGSGVGGLGALRNVSGNNTWGGSITLAATAKINVANSSDKLFVEGLVNESATSSLVKDGPGTLVLKHGNSSYSGDTTVLGGQLIVKNTTGSGTGTGNVIVASGSLLGGDGIIGGGVTIQSGAAVSPGNSPGTLSMGSETWNGGGKYLWEMNDATGAAGSDPGWDLLDVSTSLAISATPSDKFVTLITSFGGDVANFNNTASTSWQIVSVPTTTGFDPAAFTLSLLVDGLVPGSTGFTNDLNGGSFAIRLNQGLEPAGIYLDFLSAAPPQSDPIAVPEPSTLVLGTAGLAMLLARRVRRIVKKS